MKSKLPAGTLVLFVIWVTVTAFVVAFFLPDKPQISSNLMGVMRPFPTTITPLDLVDQNGQRFTADRLKGRWTFLFFGYTYCPDICPSTMTVLSSLRQELKIQTDENSTRQIVFVSVDPERDKPATISAYLSYFGDGFVGVTGTEKGLQRFAGQFGAMYSKEPDAGSTSYLISHTSSIFLLSPESKLIAAFSPPHDAKTIAAQYREIRRLL